jgi:hypothetical protein
MKRQSCAFDFFFFFAHPKKRSQKFSVICEQAEMNLIWLLISDRRSVIGDGGGGGSGGCSHSWSVRGRYTKQNNALMFCTRLSFIIFVVILAFFFWSTEAN